MPERYLSSVLRVFPGIANHIAPLSGIEARMYNRLWHSVVTGKLKPGTKLREEVIGEAFGVSRTLVRKVLFIMEQEGIVELPANRGAFVATPTPDDARHVCEAVKMIAVHAASSLAADDNPLSREDKQRLEQHIREQAIAEKEGNFLNSRMLSGEFQILLVQLHRNKVLASQFVVLITRMMMVMQLYQGARYQSYSIPFQRNLIDYIERHDHAAAAASVTEFYQSIESSLRFYNADGEADLRAILMEAPGALPEKTSRQGKRRGRTDG
jgi:DNA-binding GntR family transcriptional regulator